MIYNEDSRADAQVPHFLKANVTKFVDIIDLLLITRCHYKVSGKHEQNIVLNA